MNANRIGLLTSITVVLIVAGLLLGYVFDAYRYQHTFDRIRDSGNSKKIVTEYGVIDGKYVKLWNQNHDLIGWIHIADTLIDYPVMQTKRNPQYYLRRTFDGNRDSHGTPFMSSFSNVVIPTNNWLVYGHNMHDGTMFHDLLKYKNFDYYRQHKRLEFDVIYEGGHGIYEVVAAVLTKMGGEDGFDYESYASVHERKQYEEYIRQIKNRSLYDTGITPKYSQQLITLSTCEYSQKNGRFYLVAVRIG